MLSTGTSSINRIKFLYRKSLDIIEREIRHIETLATAVKLDAGPARDLREYTKILSDLMEVSQRESKARADKKALKAKTMSEAELAQELQKKQ